MRRPTCCIACVLCLIPWPAPHAAARQTSAPTTTLATLGERLLALHPGRKATLSDNDVALRAAIEFALAVSDAGGARAANLVDPVGYQVLPRTGPLPERPDKPVSRDTLRQRVDVRLRVDLRGAPADTVQLVRRTPARSLFPSAAQWMLPDDYLAVFLPVDGAPGWLAEPACVIVRVRAGRASVLGGTLLDQPVNDTRGP